MHAILLGLKFDIRGCLIALNNEGKRFSIPQKNVIRIAATLFFGEKKACIAQALDNSITVLL